MIVKSSDRSTKNQVDQITDLKADHYEDSLVVPNRENDQ